MAVFVCARCSAVLTAPVSEIALPLHAHQLYGHKLLPALMESGTYAVDPEPSGQPWRVWSEIGAEEAEARGVFAPVYSLSFGPAGAIVVAPGDTRGTVWIQEQCDGYCMGLDGRDGPNLACDQCGQAVATRMDDCSLWQAVWFLPNAVRRLPVDGPEIPDWQDTQPVEQSGWWSPVWTAAAGAALAHLLVATEGAPVALPDGLVAETFGPALNALLPQGPPNKKLALAGPGLPAPDADIVLVPRNPVTGKAWQLSGRAETVPLAAEVWKYMAFHREQLPVPVTGRMPDGVFRDDPLPPHPGGQFRPDSAVFRYTLARLPAVRQPWLRRIYDRVRERPYSRPF